MRNQRATQETIIMPLCEHTMRTAASIARQALVDYLREYASAHNATPKWRWLKRKLLAAGLQLRINMANEITTALEDALNGE